MREGDVIFLSASVPYRRGWIADVRAAEIEEAIVSIARAVFARRGRLVFGGHPSVSPLVAAVAGEYFPPDLVRRVRPIVTFQSRFFDGQLPDETMEMARLGWSAIEWTERRPGETPDDPGPSLALMRDEMLSGTNEAYKRHDLRPPLAMIAVGGMEGVRDEAMAFLRKREAWPARHPRLIYLFKSGGGAAARLLSPGDFSCLWPQGELNTSHAERLDRALLSGDIVDAESGWWKQHEAVLPRGVPFQPYAVISQWVVDSLPGPTGPDP